MSLQGWEGQGAGLSGLPATLGHVCVDLSQDLIDGANTAALAPLTEVDQLLSSPYTYITGFECCSISL